jgi:transposase InsO family protein
MSAIRLPLGPRDRAKPGPRSPNERIDQRSCGDLTEVPTDEGKLYPATVLDLASRRLPGFAMSGHHDSALAKAALCMAAAIRGGDVDGVIFHSDKGGEYVGDLFISACSSLGVTQPMGRVGSALDNVAAESFNSTLEHELLSRQRFATKDQAAGRSPGSSTPTTTGAATAAATCSRRSPTNRCRHSKAHRRTTLRRTRLLAAWPDILAGVWSVDAEPGAHL